jgi:hypothetical protein
VDAVRNLPMSSGYAKAILSVTPPGTLYLPTPLTTGVHFTVDSELDSPIRHPRWQDGWKVRAGPRRAGVRSN